METCTVNAIKSSGAFEIRRPGLESGPHAALERWIKPQELEAVRQALARGGLPSDLLQKLRGLATRDLAGQSIEQNCRLFAALLLASEHGSFRAASRTERERLLRVLAYVRKDDDAIPDYQTGGFADDQREVRAAASELAELLQAFKAWRLRFQVPAMWADRNAISTIQS
jgi:hypothetical protein